MGTNFREKGKETISKIHGIKAEKEAIKELRASRVTSNGSTVQVVTIGDMVDPLVDLVAIRRRREKLRLLLRLLLQLSIKPTASSNVHEVVSSTPVTSISVNSLTGVPYSASLTKQNVSVDSVQLTQATRPMRRL
ncbi:hypothetical protein QYF36_006544 [Acer negundo]|nr:hypothetical protein QYF36_006544 [Acer negundo]